MCKAVWLSAVSYTSEGSAFVLFIVTEKQRHNAGSSSSLPRTSDRRDLSFPVVTACRSISSHVPSVPVFLCSKLVTLCSLRLRSASRSREEPFLLVHLRFDWQ